MNLPLKILKQNGESFVPVTTAEAVMVKNNAGVKRLDEVLKFKIEEIVTPAGSGLTSSRLESGEVKIIHTNTITPTDTVKPKLIKYDNNGHITGTEDFKKVKVYVNDNEYATYDGSVEKSIRFGDDFKNDNGNILITWNNLTNLN